uniref:tRNA:m(4)X modification enzyme TRM13 n=1 Tax=Amphilophus citrinellus TaxID=61819 RepID=A0A3Q0RER2_AMPCI
HWQSGTFLHSPGRGRCAFFVQKKKRFCKMVAGKGKKYCGEHATMEEDGGGSRRIICPLDPKHTVTEDRLQKHLKKCNSREKPKPVRCSIDPSIDRSRSLSERSRTELESLLDKLKTAIKGLQCDIEDSVLSHPALHDELNNPKNGDSAHKHLKQQSSILGHLEELGLLGRGRCFVEFGAGRGKLSHWIHEALKTCEDLKRNDDLQLLLVERCSTRFKVDGKHQDVGVQFERLQVDIQHLDLSKVPLLQEKKLPLVGVGKHLCGAATDLALRCLLETPGLTEEDEPPHKCFRPSEPSEPRPGDDPESAPASSRSDAGSGPVLGLAVALCCHHRCEWRHYTGKQFFLQRGLGAPEFSAFCRMSSWATCGLRPTNQDCPQQDSTNQRGDGEEHEPAEEDDAMNGFLSAAEREQVGHLCKQLIDSGRCHFLKMKGYSSKLTRYIGSDVTLENILLTAVRTLPNGTSAPWNSNY